LDQKGGGLTFIGQDITGFFLKGDLNSITGREKKVPVGGLTKGEEWVVNLCWFQKPPILRELTKKSGVLKRHFLQKGRYFWGEFKAFLKGVKPSNGEVLKGVKT